MVKFEVASKFKYQFCDSLGSMVNTPFVLIILIVNIMPTVTHQVHYYHHCHFYPHYHHQHHLKITFERSTVSVTLNNSSYIFLLS